MLAVLPGEFRLQTPGRIAEGEVVHRVGHIGKGRVDVALFGRANLQNPKIPWKIPMENLEIPQFEDGNSGLVTIGDYEILQIMRLSVINHTPNATWCVYYLQILTASMSRYLCS